MNHHPVTTADPQTTSPKLLWARILFVAIALMMALLSGCSRLRLPAIDPTGSRIFAPLPTTTTLAIPGISGEGCGCFNCLSGLNCFRGLGLSTGPRFQFPDPVFTEPAAPPACPTPGSSIARGASNEPCVPSAACNGSCVNGPPAVLLGDECNARDFLHLPERGDRGCILLSPQKIVAPVGGEVVLLSGICGTDGYLQMNEKLEWMLTPESVGTFIQVGDDDPGFLHRLAGSKLDPEKKDPSYAIGRTSTKRTLITRGNNDPRDDVQLEKGQTWLTISSPSEGTSRVTVLAPESDCWDQRKATATIYWVDARWQFPSVQIVPAGQPTELTTRVTRAEGGNPARGWKVRYEIQQPELATFAGTNGASVVEANVDDSGNATVQLIPTPGTAGTTAVNMEIIRPGGDSDNLPTLTLGSGQTFVTWSSPQLAIRAGGPDVASFDTPVQVFANVSNAGDQPVTNVVVDVELPPGTRVTNADSFARVLPNSVTWEIGTIPPQQQLDLFMEVAAQSTVDLRFQARGDGLVDESTVRIDVFRPSMTLKVEPVDTRVESGQPARFNIDVTNTGDRPLTNLEVTATGDEFMVHNQKGTRKVTILKNEGNEPGPLQPGGTWGIVAEFVPTTAGRRCVTFEATADGGQRQTATDCVTAINPIPETPTLSATVQVPKSRVATGDGTFAQARIANTGRGVAKNVRVNMVYDPQLQLVEATEGADAARLGQNIVSWTIPEIGPNQEVKLEGVFTAIRPTSQARVAVSAQSDEGATANSDLSFEIVQATTPAQPLTPPELPPANPTPQIPGGAAPAPLSGPPSTAPGTLPGPAVPQRSNRLIAKLLPYANPVQVNQAIRYSLRLVNDSDQADGQIDVQFELPPGVRLERVNQRKNPELSQFRADAGVVSLAPIPRLVPGEDITYELVMSSNQPQTFDLNVDVRSQRFPNGIRESVTTTVIQ